MTELLKDPERASNMAARGRDTILARHTCSHRVDELMNIVDELNGNVGRASVPGLTVEVH